MSLLSLFARKPLLNTAEKTVIEDAIHASEKKTSGEIVVYIESHCKFVNPLDLAEQLFHETSMGTTASRNAVLVYVAIKDRQLAVFADEGIYQKAGAPFWNTAVAGMLRHFNKSDYGNGIATVVTEIGNSLEAHFPYDGQTDINELPDNIVFGR